MKKIFSIVFLLALVASSCAKKEFDPILGRDRDDHGCLGSAGYTWSYALHDCVRIWEVGERYENNTQAVSLVYSADSVFAEIFTEDGRNILLRRKGRHVNEWTRRKGNERVSIFNGITTVFVNDYNFTK